MEYSWIKKHPNWFAAANLFAPNTNNAIEGFNSSIKSVHTLHRRLPLTTFKETMLKMLSYKSKMYVRDAEKKVFYDKLNISRNDWSTDCMLRTRKRSRKFSRNSNRILFSQMPNWIMMKNGLLMVRPRQTYSIAQNH